jgi:hypothetical protein
VSNLHATDRTGKNFASKAALRRALVAGDPITFRGTDLFNHGRHYGIGDITPADVIVGPDPERNRAWYANIKNGKVV